MNVRAPAEGDEIGRPNVRQRLAAVLRLARGGSVPPRVRSALPSPCSPRPAHPGGRQSPGWQ